MKTYIATFCVAILLIGICVLPTAVKVCLIVLLLMLYAICYIIGLAQAEEQKDKDDVTRRP